MYKQLWVPNYIYFLLKCFFFSFGFWLGRLFCVIHFVSYSLIFKENCTHILCHTHSPIHFFAVSFSVIHQLDSQIFFHTSWQYWKAYYKKPQNFSILRRCPTPQGSWRSRGHYVLPLSTGKRSPDQTTAVLLPLLFCCRCLRPLLRFWQQEA